MGCFVIRCVKIKVIDVSGSSRGGKKYFNFKYILKIDFMGFVNR